MLDLPPNYIRAAQLQAQIIKNHPLLNSPEVYARMLRNYDSVMKSSVLGKRVRPVQNPVRESAADANATNMATISESSEIINVLSANEANTRNALVELKTINERVSAIGTDIRTESAERKLSDERNTALTVEQNQTANALAGAALFFGVVGLIIAVLSFMGITPTEVGVFVKELIQPLYIQ